MDEKTVHNVLYVHGLSDGQNSLAHGYFETIRDFYSNQETNVYDGGIDLSDATNAITGIRRLCAQYSRKGIAVDTIIGESIAAFYLLSDSDKCRKIVINPCLKPTEQSDKYFPSITEAQKQELESLERTVTRKKDEDTKLFTYSVFTTEDEPHSYTDEFASSYGITLFGTSNYICVPGKHILEANQLKNGLSCADDFLSLVARHKKLEGNMWQSILQ